MEASFPCPLEQTVASALLLLSSEQPHTFSPPPPPSPPEESKSNSSEKCLALCNSKSSSSSVTCDYDSSAEARAPPLRMVAVVARCHEMKLKVVRKSRSKVIRISDDRKINSGFQKAAVSSGCASATTTEASSCLSSSSSAVSSARSGKKAALARDLKKKPPASSALMRRRADSIVRLLSNGSASEVRIRQLLGDSPDTSKALRMLLKHEEVKRSGAGGRGDPYIYKIAQK